MHRLIMLASLGLVLGCTAATPEPPPGPKAMVQRLHSDGSMAPPPQPYLAATFAGGCFWCSEDSLSRVHGVVDVISGFTGGSVANPSYRAVVTGGTGHTEAVRVIWDPRQTTYRDLVEAYWRHFDPTDGTGQFADRGPSYRPAIFVHNDEQRRLATASKARLAASGRFSKAIAVPIEPVAPFWPAEAKHQNYSRLNPDHYQAYKTGSGRAGFIARHWKDRPMDKKTYDKPDDLREKLDDLQYAVTQQDATERPFANAYWDNKAAGIYVDVVSGEPLFASTAKFDSGTGWPSFFKALEPANVVEKQDSSHGMIRVEVRSKNGDSHLGHLFDDGPAPTGLRYCINSASLRFIPVADLEAEGFGQYADLFAD